MDENGIAQECQTKHTRQSFMEWVVKLNNECLDDTDSMIHDIYAHKNLNEVFDYVIDFGKYAGKSLAEIYKNDSQYLEWVVDARAKHYSIVQCYIEKMKEAGINNA